MKFEGIYPLSSKPATKESTEYLPHAVFIYSPKKIFGVQISF